MRSLSESHKAGAGRRARRDLAVLLRITLESGELATWLDGLEPDPLCDIPRYPTILQALFFKLPEIRKMCAASCQKVVCEELRARQRNRHLAVLLQMRITSTSTRTTYIS